MGGLAGRYPASVGVNDHVPWEPLKALVAQLLPEAVLWVVYIL